MKIYLVRHGETESNGMHRYLGRSDEPLSEIGLQQAQAVSNYLANNHINTMICSTLRRAKQTAKAIADQQKVELTIKEELDEIDFGKWEGLTYSEIYKDYPDEITLWLKKPEGLDIPGGEKWHDFRDRVIGFAEKIATNNSGNVCIVSHGGPLRFIISYYLGLKLPCFIGPSSLMLDHGGLTTISYDDGFATIENINDVSYLNGLRKIYRFETQPEEPPITCGIGDKAEELKDEV